MLSLFFKTRADTLPREVKQIEIFGRFGQLWLLRQKWQSLKMTLPQKNSHRIKTPSSEVMILVSWSSCWEKDFTRINAHNFFILSLICLKLLIVCVTFFWATLYNVASNHQEVLYEGFAFGIVSPEELLRLSGEDAGFSIVRSRFNLVAVAVVPLGKAPYTLCLVPRKGLKRLVPWLLAYKQLAFLVAGCCISTCPIAQGK